MKTFKTAIYTLLLASLLSSTAAFAASKTVTTEGLKFKPMVVKIAPGDTVNWTNMAIHDVHMMYVPKGAKAFRTRIGNNFSHKFTKQGIYIYQCDPHIGYGMGGVVIVGKPVNLAALKSAHAMGAIGMIVHKGIKAAEKM